AVIADRRRRRSRILRLRLAAGALAAAASVLIGLWAAGAFRPSGPENHLTGNTPHALERPRAPEPAPAEWASLEDGLAEVTGAVIELTRRTADETVQQTRLFLPMPGEVPPALEFPDPGGALGPAARSLGEIQQGAVVALSPVGDSAVRAVRLFLGNPSGPSDPGS
ncbi:MAG TPA: hypothetical protein VIL46_11635, partial [Gemmataceae bacterium]